MKISYLVVYAVLAACACSSLAVQNYSKNFTLTDSFGVSPFRVQNAFLRTEPFGTPVRYWQPSAANVWGEVVYRFDLGFVAQTASTFMSVSAYTSGADVNFDNGAEAYVDVSTDDVHYTNLLGKYPGNGGGVAGPGDITSLVAGSDVIYIRARLLMTTDYGSFGTAQFLRGDPGQEFNLSATAVPEPASAILIVFGAVLCLRRRTV